MKRNRPGKERKRLTSQGEKVQEGIGFHGRSWWACSLGSMRKPLWRNIASGHLGCTSGVPAGPKLEEGVFPERL